MTNVEREQLEKEFNKKYAKKIKRIEEKNFVLQKKMDLRRMRKNLRKGVGLTTTKLLCFYIFIIFNVVLAYALIAMWHFADLSYLGVIISDILGQVVVYAIYSIRAYKDTKSEEEMRFERDKLNMLPDSARDKLNEIFDKIDDISNLNLKDPQDYDVVSNDESTSDDSDVISDDNPDNSNEEEEGS